MIITHSSVDFSTEHLGDLDRDLSCTAGRRMDEDLLTLLKARYIHERVPRSHYWVDDSTSLLQRERVRNLDGISLITVHIRAHTAKH